MLAVLVLICGALVGAVWKAGGRSGWIRARVAYRAYKIQGAPTTPIAQCVAGSIVKISGRVEAVSELLEAPLTADAGVATLTSVEIHENPRAPTTTLYVRDERVSDFIVRDDSGSALVRGRRAAIVSTPRVVVPDGERKGPWLRRWDAHERFLGVFSRTLRFFEATLEPGAPVTVLGRCVERSGGPEGPYRESAEPTIILDAPERGHVIVHWQGPENPTPGTPLFTEN